jgi:uncharacterized protein YbjT (DUF2867 family)
VCAREECVPHPSAAACDHPARPAAHPSFVQVRPRAGTTWPSLAPNGDSLGRSGIKGIVYLSVFKGDTYTDVPHFAGKHTVERMIEDLSLPATVLRPAYFIQNDLRQKEPLLKSGVYGIPIGSKGVSMVDIRDIGESAAIKLLRRHRAPEALSRETYGLVGPDALNGEQIATIWGEALGQSVRYGGDDLAAMEQRMKGIIPSWHAMDLRLMLSRYQTDGAVASATDLARLTTLLGHAPRSYRAFAIDAAAQWAGG